MPEPHWRAQIGEKTLSYTPHEFTRIRVVLTILELGTTKVLFLQPNLTRKSSETRIFFEKK